MYQNLQKNTSRRKNPKDFCKLDELGIEFTNGILAIACVKTLFYCDLFRIETVCSEKPPDEYFLNHSITSISSLSFRLDFGGFFLSG